MFSQLFRSGIDGCTGIVRLIWRLVLIIGRPLLETGKTPGAGEASASNKILVSLSFKRADIPAMRTALIVL